MKIALLNDYQRVALRLAPWERLPGGVMVEPFHDHLDDLDALTERLHEFDIVMALRERTRFPRELLQRLPRLKMIASAGRRNAAIDVEACTELGILVCGTSGSVQSTMELTWGLILALMRQIPRAHADMRAGLWQSAPLGVGLAGKALGLVGLGRIGGMMAEVARVFQMETLAWSENLTAARAAECGAVRVSREELLARADVLSIHLVLGERTRGLIGEAELKQMRPSAYLVNTSRGPIVSEPALIAALRSGAIAGAALDVYDQEPLPADHPLRTLENVVLAPHVGFVTEEVYAGFYGESLANIEAYLRGQPEQVTNAEVLERLRPRTD